MSFDWRAFVLTTLAVSAVATVLTALLWSNPSVPGWSLPLLWLGALGVVAFRMRRSIRRMMSGDEPSPGVVEALESRVSFYRRLDDEAKQRFRTQVHHFLLDQHIDGVGIDVDDELRALVASSAVVLTFGLERYEWDNTRDIVIYPEAFDEDYAIGRGKTRLGQVGSQGPVILSAVALRAGFANSTDGHNVGLHEFAHVLDFDDGEIDGIPANLDWNSIRPWVDRMGALMDKVDKSGHKARVLRAYGYTNEAEFFACATEMFFEQPDLLDKRAPELFALLQRFFRQDLRKRAK